VHWSLSRGYRHGTAPSGKNPEGLLDTFGNWDILAGDLENPMNDKKVDQPIKPDLFNHLVELAALELTDEEAEYLRQELNNQLRAIEELEAIPLGDETPITSHGVPYSTQITPEARPDEWIACPNPDEIIAQAPFVRNGYVIVPDIPHTELE
jgi:aspartyl-tRNA(Asn)/glutamyl-tRNA(Gln) amidotransferase subunit C